jgi:D-alanine-D-alanine ligase
MSKSSVLVLFNQPQLPGDHPDAAQEHVVVEIADHMRAILTAAGFGVGTLALGVDPEVLWSELKRHRPDVVFNLYEGQLDNPESESFVAGLLDWSGIPYTGSPPQALALARAKDTVKCLLRGAGLATANSELVERLPAPACNLTFPVIVKPARQDASVGVDQQSVCTSAQQRDERVRHVFATYGPPVLIEEYIAGRELNIALIELPDLQALAPAEIVFQRQEPGAWPIVTYAAKWVAGSDEFEQTPTCFPADLSAGAVAELNRLAMAAYRLIGCRDYARVDFRLKPTGQAYILEVNPNSDISAQADLTHCLGSAQLTHEAFIVRLVETALQRNSAPKPTFGANWYCVKP